MSRVLAGVILTTALGLTAALVAAPPAAGASDMTVVDVEVIPASDDLADGLGYLTLELTLQSASGLRDELTAGVMNDLAVAYAEPEAGEHPWLEHGETPPDILWWPTLTRVTGTPQDGVWRGTVPVTHVVSGTWVMTAVYDYGTPEDDDWVDITGFDVTIDVGDGEPPWRALPAPTGPVRVVHGDEEWTPRARVTDRDTGSGIAAFWIDYNFYGEPTTGPVWQYPATYPLPRADRNGYLALPSRPVVFEDGEYSRNAIHVYGGRGSRGYSWEAATALWPVVKWQANQRFATSGRTVTATGNAWPAPAIYDVGYDTIHLQRLVGSTWRTVASSHVRDNGRYTITWTAPTAGTHVLRVYKPGSMLALGVRGSVGTQLAAVNVTTR